MLPEGKTGEGQRIAGVGGLVELRDYYRGHRLAPSLRRLLPNLNLPRCVLLFVLALFTS